MQKISKWMLKNKFKDLNFLYKLGKKKIDFKFLKLIQLLRKFKLKKNI